MHAAAKLGLMLLAGLYAFAPVKNQPVRTKESHVVKDVHHFNYVDDGGRTYDWPGVAYRVARVLEGDDIHARVLFYRGWPKARELENCDTVAFKEMRGKTRLGMDLEKTLGIRALEWPRRTQLEIAKGVKDKDCEGDKADMRTK